MRLMLVLLVSLAICLTTSVGSLHAAEIEVVQGLDPNQKAILVRGPIEEGDDSRFFEVAKETPRAIVFLESPEVWFRPVFHSRRNRYP